MSDEHSGPGAAVVHRLSRAIDDHDLDAVLACFTEDFRSEVPVHPDRSFTGREGVRANWGTLLSTVPDLSTTVVRLTEDGSTVWAEWEQRGTTRDGSPHLVRGVFIFGIRDGRAQWVRFYLEPVATSSTHGLPRHAGPPSS